MFKLRLLVVAVALFPVLLLEAQVPSPLPDKPVLTLIPHVVTGGDASGGYVTRVFVTNLSTGSNAVVTTHINQNGTLALGGNQFTLAGGGTLDFSTAEADRFTNQLVQWIAIGSDAAVSATVLFDFRFSTSAQNETVSAVGVLPQAPGTAFTAPFVFQRQTAIQPVLAQGLAVANSSSSTNRVTVRVVDQDGVQRSSDTLADLQPFGQAAYVISDLPNASAALQNAPAFIGSVVVTGTQPFAPLFVGNLGGRLFSASLTRTAQ